MQEIHPSSLHRTESKEWLLLLEGGHEVYIRAPSFIFAQSAAFIYKLGYANLGSRYRYQLKVSDDIFLLSLKVTKRKSSFDTNPIELNLSKVRFSSLRRRAGLPVLTIPSSMLHLPTHSLSLQETFEEKLKGHPFQDPFTELSSVYFQRIDPYFLPTHKFDNSHVFSTLDGALELLPRKEVSREMNRSILEVYSRHIKELYGLEKLRVIEHRFEFNIEKMIEDGSPLTPEHVYRINIGMNNLEMNEVESLYEKLIELKNIASTLSKNKIQLLKQIQDRLSLTLRELRQLYRILDRQSLENYLAEIFTDSPITGRAYDLNAPGFNALLELLLTPHEYFDLAFTGKKIVHKAISGYYTIGGKKKFKPWFDLHELLQTFLGMQKKDDWLNFYELLSHIVSKKHLIRRHPDNRWNVGALIPGPRMIDGQKRWYYIDSWTEDNRGDFNYTLVPASKDSGKRVAIKLYRSTASDQYNMFGWNTIKADLSSSGAPGGENRHQADNYELPFFTDRTIPIWLAYQIAAKELLVKNDEDKPSLIRAFDLLNQACTLIPDNKKASFERLLDVNHNTIDLEGLKQACDALSYNLEVLAQELNERLEDKIETDIAFVGHSLGGALSQACFSHFATVYNRIPLPGCRYICYCSNSPGVTQNAVTSFWDFVNKHSMVIENMSDRWEIITQLEYGDLVAQSGSCHLSCQENALIDSVSLKSQLFKPLKSAKAKPITTLPTHGRRIAEASNGLDYDLKIIASKDILELNHSYWLSPSSAELFGFKFFKSPKLLEATRRAGAYLMYPFHNLSKAIWHKLKKPRGASLRDECGVAHVSYHSPLSHLLKKRGKCNITV